MVLPNPTSAQFYDGRTARAHAVSVGLAADRMTLEITAASLPTDLHWPLTDLRALPGHASEAQLVLTRRLDTEDESPRDPARLILEDPEMVAWLRKTRPNLSRADVRTGTGKRVAVTLGAAVLAVLSLLFVILPALANSLAQVIPLQREVAFGKSVTAQMERVLGASEIGELHCDGPEGRAALDALTERLLAGQDIPYALDVLVFDHPMVNAFAAPGGQVVLMRGFLEEAPGPDAVAGVLAHEIAHVVNRDPTRAALRTVGSAGLLSLVLGDVTGGALFVFLGEQLMNTSYSRDAEAAADRAALNMLDSAEISAQGMGLFFEDILEMQQGFALPEILSSHPDTSGRATQALEHAKTQTQTSSALSPSDWRALQKICA